MLLLGLALIALTSCAGGGQGAQSAVAELQRVAQVAAGQPILVFIYTDG